MAKKSSQKLPATKEDLKKLEKTWLDMENLKHGIKDEMSLLRNDMAGMKDEIVGEIKAMREEDTAHQGAHQRHEETLEDHEERITSLEQPKFT